MKHMHPFIAAELKNKFNLGKALRLAMLPVGLDSDGPTASCTPIST